MPSNSCRQGLERPTFRLGGGQSIRLLIWEKRINFESAILATTSL